MHLFMKTAALAVLTFLSSQVAISQEASLPLPEDSFTSENAVLDTSILFAIGGREARQELRGAFGWPTFQEGLVEGVYFRFDPDGYARFAPSPRLDTDVFEVICRPRTLVCMGRKDSLQVTLNNRGQVQLEIADITENDKFVLADGISELPLPAAILQPLEPRLELLLAAGGELIVRRNDSDSQKISLAGFGAIVPYLRWVAARQDYTVLPRGWPIPNTATGIDRPGLTQTSLWQSPMPQPHVVTQAQPQAAAPALPEAPVLASGGQVEQDVAEVRGELNVLRELLLEQQTPAETPEVQISNVEVAQASKNTEQHSTPQKLEARITELMQMTATLQQELSNMQRVPAQPPVQPALGALPSMQPENPRDIARHLDYLMSEVGLAPDVALMVVQQAQQSHQASADVIEAEQNQVINDILSELRTQLPSHAREADINNDRNMQQPLSMQQPLGVQQPMVRQQPLGIQQPLSRRMTPRTEYQLFSDYLQSTMQDQ